jgi:polyhydroxybutyrate depolymerase
MAVVILPCLEVFLMRRFNRRPVVCLMPLVIISMTGMITEPVRADAQPGGLDPRHWNVDGVRRVALVHIPAEANQHSTPIIFAFHGHNGTMNQAEKDFALHIRWPKAIVVYPQGVRTPAGNDPKGKQTGWQYHPGEVGDRDLKFFDVMLASLRQEVKVDDKRVYAVGFSNGGGFAYVLWAARGDQISAVVSCAMIAPKKLIDTFKPKPLLQIAGSNDSLQPVPAEEKTALAVAKLNECGEGQPWGNNSNCTIYPSKIGAPVVFMIHDGGHEIPTEAGARIVEFLQKETPHSGGAGAAGRAANPAVGKWHLTQPSVGESDLQITESAGKLEVQEIGQGGAKSTLATCADGLLVIHWRVNDTLRGYWVLNLNEDYTKGAGKTVFIRSEGFEPGQPAEIAGRKVRIVEGVTIERSDGK